MSHFLFFLAVTTLAVVTVTFWLLLKGADSKKNLESSKQDDDFEVRGI